jgi:Ssp1 endopeptidase immunity protein Rap1a
MNIARHALRGAVLATTLGYLLSSSAFLTGTPAHAANATGYDLYRDCTATSAYDKGFCLGVIVGVYAEMDSGLICAPEVVKYGQLEMIFLNWARNHPAKLSVSHGTAVHIALADAFPCSARPR